MQRTLILVRIVVLILAMTLCGGARAELVVLTSVMAGKQPLTKDGPKGEKAAPVVRRIITGSIAQAIQREAGRGTVKFVVDLDQRAQQLSGATNLEPTFLFLSSEDGGFARRGFWLSGADNQLAWRNDPYVDMTVTQASINDGGFEEEFAHEMGHILLRRIFPLLPDGMSRVPHSSLAVTDYPTAFDEGFAIHFQGLARHITSNAALKSLDKGAPFKPFLQYWQSNLDRAMRIRGMRENLFVQRQAPVDVRVGDATALFDPTHFKNGQQMMASEGVVATLFYHLMVDPADDAVKRLDRYHALMASIRTLNGQKLGAGTPFFLNLMRAHAIRVPTERSRWFNTVLGLTYGATASKTVLDGMTTLSATGQEGRGEEFAALLKKSRAALSELTARVMRDPQRLGDALGPEIWVAFKRSNDGRADAGADERMEEVETINLNTAERTSLIDVLGLEPLDAELALSDRRSRGAYRNIDDFIARRKASTTLRQRLLEAQALAKTAGAYRRQ